jgi:hypothetical protein
LTAERDYSNGYADVELTANFTGPTGKVAVRGFWDGGRTFKIRFTPPLKGQWTYETTSVPADAGLKTAGQFEAAGPRSSSHGFLRRDERHPTSFVFDDGTRHFMWGTTHYHLLLNARAGDRWKEAIDGAMRYGMSKTRISLATPRGESRGYPGSAPFQDEARRQPDLEHWRTADRVIQHLNERGFLADLILFWRMNEKAVSNEMRAADHRYLRYALARYAAYPNVIWCMVNEWNYSSVPQEYWNELGTLVRGEDPWSKNGEFLRTLSIHQQTRPDWNFADQTWPSHAILQLGVRNRGASTRIGDEWAAAGKAGTRFSHGDDWGNHSIVRNWTGKHPVVNDEYGYIGEPQDDSEPKDASGRFQALAPDKHRRIMWGIAAGGGYAAAGDKHDYGNNDKPYFTANWHDAAEYGDIRRLIDFFTKRGIEYWRMAPHNDRVRSGQRVYVLAEPGRQYVVYAAAGGELALEVAAGQYAAWRYDPRTGEAEALPDVAGPGRPSFTLPAGQDWVIHLASKQPRWMAGPVLLADSLAGKSLGQVEGGRFADGGWTPVGPKDRIVWELPQTLPAGRLEIDVRNFDPKRQAKVDKSNFLGMWQTLWKNGDDVGQLNRDHWGLRIGTNYPQLKLKMHTRDACHYEKSLAPLAGGFDPARTYRFAAEWADGRTTFTLDGQPFAQWNSPALDPLDALRFVHLGSDTQFDHHGGSAIAGPVYSNLKVTALRPAR